MSLDLDDLTHAILNQLMSAMFGFTEPIPRCETAFLKEIGLAHLPNSPLLDQRLSIIAHCFLTLGLKPEWLPLALYYRHETDLQCIVLRPNGKFFELFAKLTGLDSQTLKPKSLSEDQMEECIEIIAHNLINLITAKGIVFENMKL